MVTVQYTKSDMKKLRAAAKNETARSRQKSREAGLTPRPATRGKSAA